MPGQSVFDNLWLGTDGICAAGQPLAQRRTRAKAMLTELLGRGPDALLRAGRPLSLSERQAVAICRALLREPKVLILDEATSALDVATRDRLFTAVRNLTNAGGAVLFISHRMDEVTEIADRVTVLRSGESVATLDRGEAQIGRLVELMTGGEHLVQESARPSANAHVRATSCCPAAASTCGRARSSAWPGSRARARTSTCGRCDRPERGPCGPAYVARDRREESIFPPLSIREELHRRDARRGRARSA